MPPTGRLSPSFSPLEGEAGLRIVDPIERRRYSLHTSRSVRPERVTTDAVRFPVDAAAAITTDAIHVRELVTAFVHDADGGPPVEVLPGTERTFDAGESYVELNAPIKLYVRVDGGFSVEAGPTELDLSIDAPTEVVVGARSFHERPAATITTTDRPEDLMRAVSTFGAALKTTSPERAYPTLRGHPPAIERGSALSVPEGIDGPATGVRIELPPTFESVYVAAPLAYYLGAEVRPGDRPRLTTSTGFEYHLRDREGEFDAGVERLLKRTFFLDCVVRTEGHYAVELAEREALEPVLGLDLGVLYDASLEERVERYLQVPHETIEPHLPQWALTAHLPPTPAGIEALPFVCNELAVVRAETPRELDPAEIRERVLEGYFEGDDPLVRSQSTRSDGNPLTDPDVVAIEPTESLDDAWFGDSVPVGATMGIPQGYRNRFDRTPREGEIEIAVVCNDREMTAEGTIATDVYGSREELPFDVELHEGLDRDELVEVLAADVDLLHYVGHVSADGIHCEDGHLDAAGLDDVGPDVFFLNGCSSYRQGRHLIEAGSVGGVVTIGEVVDSGAASVGRTMARLLNLGFPLRTALTIARPSSIVGGQYVVLGDGNADVAAARNGVPILCDVEAKRDGRYRLTVRAYLPGEAGMGIIVAPTVDGNECHHLAPGAVTFEVTEEALREYLEWHPYPVREDGALIWNERFASIEL